MRGLWAAVVIAGVCGVSPAFAAEATASPHPGNAFAQQVMPLLQKYCTSCHGAQKKKGDLTLEQFAAADEASLIKQIAVWQTVAERLEAREMPPEEKPQPSGAEVEQMLAW